MCRFLFFSLGTPISLYSRAELWGEISDGITAPGGVEWFKPPKFNSEFTPEKWWERKTILSYCEGNFWRGELLLNFWEGIFRHWGGAYLTMQMSFKNDVWMTSTFQI